MTKRKPDAHKHWTVDVSIDEHQGRTRARARLRWGERESVGVGMATCHPADRNLTDIGDELAVARALADLSNKVLAVTRHHIESVSRGPRAG